MPDINLSGFDNEDIDRQFTLRTGDETSSVPYDITNVDFECDIRDQKNILVLRLTSAGDDGGIVKNDMPNGVFTWHVAQGSIVYLANRSMRYDLLARAGGELRRLWGGSFKISQGITLP